MARVLSQFHLHSVHTCKVLRYGTCSLTVSPAQCAHTASVC